MIGIKQFRLALRTRASLNLIVRGRGERLGNSR
jgi:hypothetical protein